MIDSNVHACQATGGDIRYEQKHLGMPDVYRGLYAATITYCVIGKGLMCDSVQDLTL